MVSIGPYERLLTPENFQDRLTEMFGVNYFNEPIYKIVWGQVGTRQYAALDGHYDEMLADNQPCWCIQRWRAPECFGTPEMYYEFNADPLTGLCLMGEYPQFGTYETIQPLRTTYRDENQDFHIEVFPLDETILEIAIPLLLAAQEYSYLEVQAAQKAEQEQEDKEKVDMIADRLEEAHPSFYGPTSYGSRGFKTSVLDQKMNAISQMWETIMRQGYIQKKGGFVH